MLKIIDDKRLIIKVCTMYYIDNMSQKDIARKLDLSRPTISRMIENGRKLGIVEISINDNIGSEFKELENRLAEVLKLQEAIIVSHSSNLKKQRDLIGKAGAQLLSRLIREGYTVGVSMGMTLETLTNNIEETQKKDTLFIPLTGGVGTERLVYHSNAITEKMADTFHGDHLFLHAPGRVKNKEILDAILQEPSISTVLEALEKIDIAIFEIETPDKDSAIIKAEYLSPEEKYQIVNKKAAGVICLQFYDFRGSKKAFQDLNYIIGIDINLLKKIKYAIGLSHGKKDARAVIGAARGKYINTLITDEECAQEILKICRKR